MTWWNKSRPSDKSEILVGVTGECLPCEDPKNVVVIPPPGPPPNLSTKPADKVEYCFGYVCPKKHVSSTFENITIAGYEERRACQVCGEVAKPASVKKIAEAQWENVYGDGEWSWRQNLVGPKNGYSPVWWFTRWTRYKFVHYLDEPKPVKKTTRKKK